MTDLENYKIILEKYFGAGVSTFDPTKATTNNVIAALNRTDFAPFRSAFFQRLKRLANRYPNQDANKRHLLETLNLLGGDRNWEGAYAEIVAFDFLNADQDWLSNPINLSKTVPATETLASGLEMNNANLDGFYDDFDICFDVKVFADKSREILENMIGKVKKKHGISATIKPEYPLDMDYNVFREKWTALFSELENKINATSQNKFIKSDVIPELSYRIQWGAGVLMTFSSYNPYIHAEEHHKLLFAHIKKFSRIMPGLIVFVIFPWFSEKFAGGLMPPEILYRAFSRRFFCQYAKDATPASAFVKDFTSQESVSQVTEMLSGVLFLQDDSIESSVAENQNVKGYAYLNPNAKRKVGHAFRHYLSSLKFAVDDFEHDNY